MTDIDPIILKIDRLICRSRLNELAAMLGTDCSQRLARMAHAVERLPPGAYLLGAGPSTVGIIPLTVDEVVLGRTAMPSEEPASAVIDYAAADTMYFSPQEVSRTHAKIVRENSGAGVEFKVVDLGSTCGTFVNGEEIDPSAEPPTLSHGDVLSLGPAHVSTYLFYVAHPAG